MSIDTMKKYLLIIFIYVGVLWSWFQYGIFSLFSYWDEILALMFVPLFIYNIIKKKKKIDMQILIPLAIFVCAGIAGNLIYRYVDIKSVLSDCFLNIKFFMLLYAVYYIYMIWDWHKYEETIKIHLDVLSIVLLVLVVIDRLFSIFPVYEIRFGLKSEQLMFMHPSFCAASFFYLLMLRILFGNIEGKKNIIINATIGISILLTLRLKAIVTLIILGIFLFYVYDIKWRYLKYPLSICGIVGGGLIVFKQVCGYFFSTYAMKYARGALLLTSLKIIKDYFPIGTGFATFGSYMSGVNYSPLYSLYNIDNVYGMTKDNYNAICDQYWPMIIGQTGMIGLLAIIFIFIMLLRKIKVHEIVTKNQLIAGVGCIIYIVVCSTAESAICNPVCMPLAIILGLVYAQLDNSKGV